MILARLIFTNSNLPSYYFFYKIEKRRPLAFGHPNSVGAGKKPIVGQEKPRNTKKEKEACPTIETNTDLARNKNSVIKFQKSPHEVLCPDTLK
ncbi:hypothetical protein FQR65_LT13592 [Abscondita terminalis]|nr:hypothetical protein FQR65_LT13592 [Abscondita terminalis]